MKRVIIRKKPIEVEAIQWQGGADSYKACCLFIGLSIEEIVACWNGDKKEIYIATLEGIMTASIGDYIIKGVNGEFYPCKPDILEKSYDVVKEIK